ncbi:MAG: hypothetical protein HOO96_04900 [Polyangiaceae bacterium]|nr:hypothetical protein [Polyangiaceae bacterium]
MTPGTARVLASSSGRASPPPVAPSTRGECMAGPRPCPWRACRYHLGESPSDSCALDVADRGALSLEEVGALFGLTRERIRQIEAKALAKVRVRLAVLAKSHDFGDEVAAWLRRRDGAGEG